MATIEIKKVTDQGGDRLMVEGTIDGNPFQHPVWKSALYGPTAGYRDDQGNLVKPATREQRRSLVARLVAADLLPKAQPTDDTTLPSTWEV